MSCSRSGVCTRRGARRPSCPLCCSSSSGGSCCSGLYAIAVLCCSHVSSSVGSLFEGGGGLRQEGNLGTGRGEVRVLYSATMVLYGCEGRKATRARQEPGKRGGNDNQSEIKRKRPFTERKYRNYAEINNDRFSLHLEKRNFNGKHKENKRKGRNAVIFLFFFW